MFQKILCAQAYGVGKRVSEFIADFKNNYRNLEESVQLLPKPVGELTIFYVFKIFVK